MGLCAAILIVQTGCRTISGAHVQDVGAEHYGPSDPAQIEILQYVPARPHIQLGEVRVYASDAGVDTTKMESAVRVEGAKLGADAVVIWQNGFQGSGSKPGWIVTGAAIKYP